MGWVVGALSMEATAAIRAGSTVGFDQPVLPSSAAAGDLAIVFVAHEVSRPATALNGYKDLGSVTVTHALHSVPSHTYTLHAFAKLVTSNTDVPTIPTGVPQPVWGVIAFDGGGSVADSALAVVADAFSGDTPSVSSGDLSARFWATLSNSGTITPPSEGDLIGLTDNVDIDAAVSLDPNLGAVTSSESVTAGWLLATIGVGTAVVQPYHDAVIADSPLAYWRFNDAVDSGTMADSSGNSHAGTYSSSGVSGVAGLLSQDLDGSLNLSGASANGAAVSYASWMNVSALTVEALVKSTDTDFRVAAREQPTYVWSVQIVGGRCYFLSGGSIIASSTSTSYNDGATHHVAVTYDGTNVKFYKDGSADGTTAWAGPLPQPTNSNIVIGHDGTGSAGELTGTIDEVAVYSTALSSGRIAAHYAAL